VVPKQRLTFTRPSDVKPIEQALVQNRHGDGFYFAGEGAARYVYVARYEGEPIAIKMLKQPFLGEWKTLSQERQQEQRQWEEERRLQQWAEVVTMDAVS